MHLDIGYRLSELIGPIVKDYSGAYTHIKIYDYRCDIIKGFFVSTPYKGLDALVEAVVRVSTEGQIKNSVIDQS